ncbi:hypothetical protein FQA39_LY09924 [Lamprigera yunnana]|nr:hypothetical protein FQA39_LY09924 [Lamprigera yunnana]
MLLLKEKMEVMRHKAKLRNLRGEKVYTNNDQTRQKRGVDKLIKERVDEERRQGKKVRYVYQKLIIDEKEWKWNKENVPYNIECLDPDNVNHDVEREVFENNVYKSRSIALRLIEDAMALTRSSNGNNDEIAKCSKRS